MDLAVHVVRVLVVNAGSSSLKLRLLDYTDAMLASADLPAGATSVDTEAVSAAVQDWPVPDAIGHRVVHGGTRFAGPVRVDSTVRGQLDELTALAPLHQPKSLTALDAGPVGGGMTVGGRVEQVRYQR